MLLNYSSSSASSLYWFARLNCNLEAVAGLDHLNPIYLKLYSQCVLLCYALQEYFQRFFSLQYLSCLIVTHKSHNKYFFMYIRRFAATHSISNLNGIVFVL